jgi:hypothetical protein
MLIGLAGGTRRAIVFLPLDFIFLTMDVILCSYEWQN